MLIQASLVIICGAICLVCLFGVAQPARLMSAVQQIWQNSAGLYTAVTIRALFAAALIYSAGTSRFPLIVYVIGGLALISAAVLPFVGAGQLLERFQQLSTKNLRIWLACGFAFGAFLIYALWR